MLLRDLEPHSPFSGAQAAENAGGTLSAEVKEGAALWK